MESVELLHNFFPADVYIFQSDTNDRVLTWLLPQIRSSGGCKNLSIGISIIDPATNEMYVRSSSNTEPLLFDSNPPSIANPATTVYSHAYVVEYKDEMSGGANAPP